MLLALGARLADCRSGASTRERRTSPGRSTRCISRDGGCWSRFRTSRCSHRCESRSRSSPTTARSASESAATTTPRRTSTSSARGSSTAQWNPATSARANGPARLRDGPMTEWPRLDLCDVDRVRQLFSAAGAGRDRGAARALRRPCLSASFAPDVDRYAYQINLRIARARALLADGVTPVVVAAECGFADQPHLTRDFKRAVGVTPARYARAVAG
jgi:AraC-like DNA-binding protein